MPVWLLEFFDAIGLPVYEAYGLSENIVPVSMSRPGVRKLGTVGRPLPVNEVRLSPEGEIRVRGPGVFVGYWNAVDERDHPDSDGFWPTGDLGVLDADGFLQITGRKADLFKTSTGRWISPVEIEQQLRRIPYVDYALVFGAGRKAPVAVLGVDAGRLANAMGRDGGGTENVEVRDKTLSADVGVVTQILPAYRRPAALLISMEALSIDRGELTTNLKLRRKAIQEKFSARIDELYERLERLSAAPRKDSDSMPILEA
jgi:long-chain acyl-CoA synthetase